jgi:hypothetical protein
MALGDDLGIAPSTNEEVTTIPSENKAGNPAVISQPKNQNGSSDNWHKAIEASSQLESEQKSQPDWLTAAGIAGGAASTATGFSSEIANKLNFSPSLFPDSKIPTPVPVTPEDIQLQNAANNVATEHTYGTTPIQRELTQQEAAHQRALRGRTAASNLPGANQVIAEASDLGATPGGVLAPKSAIPTLSQNEPQIKAQQMLDAKNKANAINTANAAKYEAARNSEKWALRAKALGKIGLGAVGGAFAAKDIYDAINDTSLPTDERIAKGLGGLGGLAMTVPSPWTEGLGAVAVGLSSAQPYLKQFGTYLGDKTYDFLHPDDSDNSSSDNIGGLPFYP